MKTYKIAKKWLYFFYVAIPPMIILLVWGITAVFQNNPNSIIGTWLFAGLISIFILFLLWVAIDVTKRKFIFYEDKIISASAFSKTEIRTSDIKGYRIDDNQFIIESEDNQIKISKYTEGYQSIVEDFSRKYYDLDLALAFLEEIEVLNDSSYGNTEAERGAKLRQAKIVSKILNTASWIAIAWIFFKPHPYEYAFLFSALIPPLAILAVRHYKGMMRLEEKKGSQLPEIDNAIILPSIGMALRVLFDYNIISHTNVWPGVILLTATFIFLLYFRQKEFSFNKFYDYFVLAMLSVILLAYSYGLIIHINCFYDRTTPEFHTTKVANKKVTDGKVDTHYLTLSKWGNQTEEEDAQVSGSFYSQVEIGDELRVVLRKGNLDIPWYFLEEIGSTE